MAGSEDGRADQSKVISASSSLDKPSPRRADFQLSNTDRFLDLDTDRPARKTRCLKADQEGRVMVEDVRLDHADSTWGQKGPASKTFRGGSLGAGLGSSTFGGGKKTSDPTKGWAEKVFLNPQRGAAGPTAPREVKRLTGEQNFATPGIFTKE